MHRRDFMRFGAAGLAAGVSASPAELGPQPGTLAGRDYVVHKALPLGAYAGAGPATRLICAPGLRSLFVGTGALVLKDLSLVGNGAGTSYASGFAAFVRDGSIELDGVNLENFRSSYWVCGQRSKVIARNVTAVSKPGNAVDGRALSEASSVLVAIDGDLEVEDCRLRCDYIKGGVALYGASHGQIVRTLISEAGTAAEIADNAGAYAILAYAIGDGRPSLTVSDCVIDGARSCGIYAARALRVEVFRTRFARVSDRRDETLPKAAIALNASPDFELRGNTFEACYKKIVAATPLIRREIAPE